MKTPTENRIADSLPDPAATARSIHSQAATLACPPCTCGSPGASWRGDRRGLRVYSCDSCAGADVVAEIESACGFPVSCETIRGRVALWPSTRTVTDRAVQAERLAALAALLGSSVFCESMVFLPGVPWRSAVCPSCGECGRLHLTQSRPARALLACLACDMATNESGAWVFYAGGITSGKGSK
jgi:hypothetical protein